MINLIDGSHAVYPGTGDTRYGIDLRTQLAAMAMQGILSNSADWDNKEAQKDFVAKMSVGYADALIAELNRPTEG